MPDFRILNPEPVFSTHYSPLSIIFMHAEIIAIGDEILSGEHLDTNSAWLSRRLEELGVRVLYHCTAGDELEPSADVFRRAIQRADIVVSSGGLGPTADDLTRQSLAQAALRPLELYHQALEHIRLLFARRMREMPRQNEVQAMFPAGSRMIPNPHGTAPGIDLEVPRAGKNACRFFALPGVPAEMMEMWSSTLEAEIGRLAAGQNVIRRRKINCFGAGESQVEAMLPELIRRGRTPTVGITASKTTISLRITAQAPRKRSATRLSSLRRRPSENVWARWFLAKATKNCNMRRCGSCGKRKIHWPRWNGAREG